MRLIARGLAAGRLQTIASGVENIPAQGPALLVARHYHHLFDGLALFAAIPRPFHVVVALDWVRNRRTRYFMATINRIARWPVVLRGDALDRNDHPQRRLFTPQDVIRYQRRAIREAVDLLAQGRLLVVFPEGYPNVDPTFTPKKDTQEFLPFKSGFVTILDRAERRLGLSVPVVPVGLRYEKSKPWIAYIRFGGAIYRRQFANRNLLIDFIEPQVKKLSLIEQVEAKPNNK